jgi:hypothetical protein
MPEPGRLAERRWHQALPRRALVVALGAILAASFLVAGPSPAQAAGAKTVRVKIYTGSYRQTASGAFQFTTCGGNITWLLTLYINMSRVTTTGAQVTSIQAKYIVKRSGVGHVTGGTWALYGRNDSTVQRGRDGGTAYAGDTRTYTKTINRFVNFSSPSKTIIYNQVMETGEFGCAEGASAYLQGVLQ